MPQRSTTAATAASTAVVLATYDCLKMTLASGPLDGRLQLDCCLIGNVPSRNARAVFGEAEAQ